LTDYQRFPRPHRRSRASTSCCSSLPSEPRGVPGNHPHRGDTGIPFQFARSVAQHGTNPEDAGISSQTKCLPHLAIHLRHRTGSLRLAGCRPPTRMANQSTVPGPGKITCRPNHTARFSTTLTTAAVTGIGLWSRLNWRAIFQCKGRPKRSIER
jgi:hypothetical protein